jgi:hypothetical protein
MCGICAKISTIHEYLKVHFKKYHPEASNVIYWDGLYEIKNPIYSNYI